MNKFKRFFASIAVVIIAVAAVSFGALANAGGLGFEASAEDEFYEGDFVYTVTDGKATITGYVNYYDTQDTCLTVPETLGGYPVTAIGYLAFYNENFGSVEIGSNITSIGESAFSYCSNLKSIKIPNSVKTLGRKALSDCENLESAEIGNGVTLFEEYLFSYCKSLKSVKYSSDIKEIKDGAFAYCTELKSLTFSDSLKKVGESAFYKCESLESIELGNSLTSIKSLTFSGCKSLKSIVFADSVKSIDSGALYDCESLETITIGNGVKSLDDAIFYYCENIKKVKLGNGLTEIANGIFYNCKKLTEVELGSSITKIGNYAFSGCENLAKINIPNKVTDIGWNAFYNCGKLKSITIPGSVKTIQSTAFFNCKILSSVTLNEGLKTIETQAFGKCNSLKKITIPRSVTKIEYLSIGYSGNNNDENDLKAYKTSGFTISGYSNSAAQNYAKENGFKFVTLSNSKTTKITSCTISISSAAYTGKALKPTVTVKNGKTTLKNGTHYTVTYKNNTKIGKATVTIKGVEKKGYSGTKTLTFNIVPANVKGLRATQTTSTVKLTWSKVAGAAGYRVFKYDTKKKTWVKVADTKNTNYTVTKLKAGTSYKYAVKAYAKSGSTTYYSSAYSQLSTATKPGTPTLKAISASKSAKLSWNKQTGASGYMVYMATSKNGSYQKVATVKGGTKVSYTKTGLTKGKTYYFKVAAYKTADGKNIYGSYSAVKSVKVK